MVHLRFTWQYCLGHVWDILDSDNRTFNCIYFIIKSNIFSGETVDLIQESRGLDSTGAMLVDVVVTGNVPLLQPGALISLQPFTGMLKVHTKWVCCFW